MKAEIGNNRETCLSTTSLHAERVSCFEAKVIQSSPGRDERHRWNTPPRAFPILMTYGNGSRTVKLKHIVSSTSLSTPSNLCRSCSTVWAHVLVLKRHSIYEEHLLQGPSQLRLPSLLIVLPGQETSRRMKPLGYLEASWGYHAFSLRHRCKPMTRPKKTVSVY